MISYYKQSTTKKNELRSIILHDFEYITLLENYGVQPGYRTSMYFYPYNSYAGEAPTTRLVLNDFRPEFYCAAVIKNYNIPKYWRDGHIIRYKDIVEEDLAELWL